LPLRWPAIVSVGTDHYGIEGYFAYPLNVGDANIGALALYQGSAKGLSLRQHEDALIAADVLSLIFLSTQASKPVATLTTALQDATSIRAVVQQAAEILALQRKTGILAALVLLRAHAYETGRPVAEVASAVLDHRLRLGTDSDQELQWKVEP
jgi:hypothetical protein